MFWRDEETIYEILVAIRITIRGTGFFKGFWIYYCDFHRQPTIKHKNSGQRFVVGVGVVVVAASSSSSSSSSSSNSIIIGDPISDRIAVYCNDLTWRERRTTSATFLGSISAKLSTNTCPGGGSRHMVSHSRKVSIKGSNFPKNRLLGYFRVPCLCSAYGSGKMFCDAYTLNFHPLVDIHRFILPGRLLLRDVAYRFPAIHLRQSSFATCSISNGDTGMPIIFSNPLASWRHGSDRRFAVVTNPLHVF